MTDVAACRAAETQSARSAAIRPAWAEPLQRWYREHGRHALPWRLTRDPWQVLVSEVMLQQTQVVRVQPRWHSFVERWPDPAAFVAEPLPEVLRFWQGLGYPRRALALQRTAANVAEQGWCPDEAGLRALPGIGAYTARALRCFCFDGAEPLPMDTNLRRIATRVTHGESKPALRPSLAQRVLDGSRPPGVAARDHVYALFDLGAMVCTARAPKCHACPVQAHCAWRQTGAARVPGAARRATVAWPNTMRRLRGAVLAAMLEPVPPPSISALQQRLQHVPTAADRDMLRAALDSLHGDGLLAEPPWATSPARAHRAATEPG